MRRFSCKLFVLLFGAVLALASFAGAASGSQSQLRMHINDNSTVGAFCPTASQDTSTPQQCGHLEPIVFSVPGTYTVSVTVDCSTYPSSAEAPCEAQTATPTLCLEQS